MINLKNCDWAVDYDLIRGFWSFVVGLVGWRFQVAIVIVICHELHPILCLGEKRWCRCEGKTRRREEEKRQGGKETKRKRTDERQKKRSRYGIY